MVVSSIPVGSERLEMDRLSMEYGNQTPVVDLFPASTFLETMPSKMQLCIGVGVVSKRGSFREGYWSCRIAKAWSEHFMRQGCVVMPGKSALPLREACIPSSPFVDLHYWDWLGEFVEFDKTLPRNVVQDIASLSAIRSKYGATWLDLGGLGGPRMSNLAKLCDGVVLVSEPDDCACERTVGLGTVGKRSGREKSTVERKRFLREALGDLHDSGCRVLGYWDVTVS
jgi:hypothetical protein